MERLFISLSHLQHSDTAAVKDSLPQTPAQGEMTLKARYKRATTKPFTSSLRMSVQGATSNCVLHEIMWLLSDNKLNATF